MKTKFSHKVLSCVVAVAMMAGLAIPAFAEAPKSTAALTDETTVTLSSVTTSLSYAVGTPSADTDWIECTGTTQDVTIAGVTDIFVTATSNKAGTSDGSLTTPADKDTHSITKGIKPTGTSTTATTVAGLSDGKITGVTDSGKYEYKKDSDANWTSIIATGTELQGLAAGSYVIRTALDSTAKVLPSDPSEAIVIADGPAAPTKVSIAAIAGIDAPVAGTDLDTTVTPCAQYTGAITWKTNGSAAVGKAKPATVYVAEIVLTKAAGYTLNGVAKDFFTVKDAVATNSAVNSDTTCTVTATFPKTADAVVSEPAIAGIDAPVVGTALDTTATAGTGYTVGNVTWQIKGAVGAATGAALPNKTYVAEVTLTKAAGYTLNGVAKDFFTVAGAKATNDAVTTDTTCVVTAEFPATLAQAVTSLKITKAPTDVHYYVGNKVDLTGMEVEVTYADGKKETVKAADFAKKGITTTPANDAVLKLADTSLTATCGGVTSAPKTLTITINFSEYPIMIEGIVAPVIDEEPVTTAPTIKEGCKASAIVWEPAPKVNAGKSYFAANTEYKATFTLTALKDYSFASMDAFDFDSILDEAMGIEFVPATGGATGAMKITFAKTARLNFTDLQGYADVLEARIARAVKDGKPAEVARTYECISTHDADLLKTQISDIKAIIANPADTMTQADVTALEKTISTDIDDGVREPGKPNSPWFVQGTKGNALTLADQNIAINVAKNAMIGVKTGTNPATIDMGVKFVPQDYMDMLDIAIGLVQIDIAAGIVDEKEIADLYIAIDTFNAKIKTGTKPSSYVPDKTPTSNGTGSSGSSGSGATTTSGNAPVTSSSFDGAKADLSSDATNENGKAITDPKVKIEDVDLTDPSPEVRAFVIAAEGFAISDILEINLFDGSTPVEKLANGKLRVTLPFERSSLVAADAQYFILHNNGDGTVTRIPATISEDGKSISFETNQYSLFAVAVISDDMNLFNDINVDPIVVPEVKPTTPTKPGKPVIKPSVNPATGVALLGQLF